MKCEICSKENSKFKPCAICGKGLCMECSYAICERKIVKYVTRQLVLGRICK